MLYEVITDPQWLRADVEIERRHSAVHRDADALLGQELGLWLLGVGLLMAIGMATLRITSYNVCYTKLLRLFRCSRRFSIRTPGFRGGSGEDPDRRARHSYNFV